MTRSLFQGEHLTLARSPTTLVRPSQRQDETIAHRRTCSDFRDSLLISHTCRPKLPLRAPPLAPLADGHVMLHALPVLVRKPCSASSKTAGGSQDRVADVLTSLHSNIALKLAPNEHVGPMVLAATMTSVSESSAKHRRGMAGVENYELSSWHVPGLSGLHLRCAGGRLYNPTQIRRRLAGTKVHAAPAPPRYGPKNERNCCDTESAQDPACERPSATTTTMDISLAASVA